MAEPNDMSADSASGAERKARTALKQLESQLGLDPGRIEGPAFAVIERMAGEGADRTLLLKRALFHASSLQMAHRLSDTLSAAPAGPLKDALRQVLRDFSTPPATPGAADDLQKAITDGVNGKLAYSAITFMRAQIERFDPEHPIPDRKPFAIALIVHHHTNMTDKRELIERVREGWGDDFRLARALETYAKAPSGDLDAFLSTFPVQVSDADFTITPAAPGAPPTPAQGSDPAPSSAAMGPASHPVSHPSPPPTASAAVNLPPSPPPAAMDLAALTEEQALLWRLMNGEGVFSHPTPAQLQSAINRHLDSREAIDLISFYDRHIVSQFSKGQQIAWKAQLAREGWSPPHAEPGIGGGATGLHSVLPSTDPEKLRAAARPLVFTDKGELYTKPLIEMAQAYHALTELSFPDTPQHLYADERERRQETLEQVAKRIAANLDALNGAPQMTSTLFGKRQAKPEEVLKQACECVAQEIADYTLYLRARHVEKAMFKVVRVNGALTTRLERGGHIPDFATFGERHGLGESAFEKEFVKALLNDYLVLHERGYAPALRRHGGDIEGFDAEMRDVFKLIWEKQSAQGHHLEAERNLIRQFKLLLIDYDIHCRRKKGQSMGFGKYSYAHYSDKDPMDARIKEALGQKYGLARRSAVDLGRRVVTSAGDLGETVSDHKGAVIAGLAATGAIAFGGGLALKNGEAAEDQQIVAEGRQPPDRGMFTFANCVTALGAVGLVATLFYAIRHYFGGGGLGRG